VPGPSGAFVGTLAVLALVVARGWPASPPALRRHLLLAATINLPLLLVFSATGELRNLSFLYVGLALLVARAMDRKLTS
jgi:formate/nitrite transporter FocA (FNT family)